MFLGEVHEPVKGTKNPQKMLNSGIPFTKKPIAIQFDYKGTIQSDAYAPYRKLESDASLCMVPVSYTHLEGTAYTLIACSKALRCKVRLVIWQMPNGKKKLFFSTDPSLSGAR